MTLTSLVLIAGETSGDEIGALIVEALKRRQPDLFVAGAVGPRLRAAQCEEWVGIESFQVMGLLSVLKKLPSILSAARKLEEKILETNPDVLLFIDQPSFSSFLAQRLAKKYAHLPREERPLFIQVVAPSVWAYKPGRAEKLGKTFDALFVLYQFEVPYFSPFLPTYWIGHPAMPRGCGNHRSVNPRVLALYPGSRPQEIQLNIALQLAVAASLKNMLHELVCVVQLTNTTSQKERAIIEMEAKKAGLVVQYSPFSERFDLMQRAVCALAKSGTVTLELALMRVPTLVVYNVHWLTRLWAKYVLGLSEQQKFALPNILTGNNVLPEYIVEKPCPQRIATHLVKLATSNTPQMSNEEYRALRDNILPKDEEGAPAERAACLLMDLIRSRRGANQ